MRVVITEQFARDQRRFAAQPAVLADLALAAGELARGDWDSPQLETTGVQGSPGLMTSRAGRDHRIGWVKQNGSAILLLLDRETEIAQRTQQLALELVNGRTAVVESQDIEAVFNRPLEDWMVLLHPEQIAAVERRFDGPALLAGAPGTGKTIVAIHRAARLAAQGRDVLFTTPRRPFPPDVEAMYRAFAPETTENVRFSGIDAYALSLVPRAAAGLSARRTQPAWEEAWDRLSRRRQSALLHEGLDKERCRTEIARAIKGRGLTALDRARYVESPATAAVWSLFLVYERCLRARQAIDHADVLRIARDHARAQRRAGGHDAVIVDDAQHLTTVGLDLMLAVAGKGQDGLLLVGGAGELDVGDSALTLRHDHSQHAP